MTLINKSPSPTTQARPPHPKPAVKKRPDARAANRTHRAAQADKKLAARRHRHPLLNTAVGAGLLTFVVAAGLWSMSQGQFEISVTDVAAILWSQFLSLFGMAPDSTLDPIAVSTIMDVRLPRVLLGLLVGVGLASAGAATQGIFANPLAEPGIIGVSSGAALGASASIALGWAAFGPFALPLSAFIGGLLATILVYSLSRSAGKSQVLTLVLTGIALNAVAGAGIALFTTFSESSSREQIVFWQMGSLNGSTWRAVATAGIFIIVGVAVLSFLGRRLDILSLGDRTARSTGLNVEAVRVTTIITVALVTGAAVAYAGVIGFLGLVVPHALRLVIGPSNVRLIPYSALGGAGLLMVADVFARTLIPFADLPIGIFTALVGGPVFFILLRQTLRKQGVL